MALAVCRAGRKAEKLLEAVLMRQRGGVAEQSSEAPAEVLFRC